MGPDKQPALRQSDVFKLLTSICKKAATISEANEATEEPAEIGQICTRAIEELELDEQQTTEAWAYFMLASYAAKKVHIEQAHK